MTCEANNRAELIPGSKLEFYVDLVDENTGRPVSLSTYDEGYAVFTNEAGDRIAVSLTVPGANPDQGSLLVSVPGATTANFDKCSLDFDIELLNSSTLELVVPINNAIELKERNTPVATP